MQEAEGGGEELAVARFPDRLVAFALDFLLVLIVYNAATFGVARFAPDVLRNTPVGNYWSYSSLLMFLLYHAVLGSGGRRTAGKALMGIKVVRTDGEEPGFGTALLRAVSYLVSTAALGLGFFWAAGASKQAWHDKICGTAVVETREKSAAARKTSLAAAWVLGPVMAAVWIWMWIGAPYYMQMQLVANAQVALKTLASLDQSYRRANGAFAPDLDTLLKASGHEAEFKENLALIFDMSTLKLIGDTTSFSLEGIALDNHRTQIKIHSAPQAPASPAPSGS